MLPQNRCHVRRRSFQAVVAAHQRPLAHGQPFIKNFPELLHIPARGTCDIHQIQRHDTLVKPAIKLILVFRIFINSQKRTAAHAGIAAALFQLFHHFFRNIIRHHALCCTPGRYPCQVIIFAVFVNVIFFEHVNQLWKRWRDVNALLIHNALNPLV